MTTALALRWRPVRRTPGVASLSLSSSAALARFVGDGDDGEAERLPRVARGVDFGGSGLGAAENGCICLSTRLRTTDVELVLNDEQVSRRFLLYLPQQHVDREVPMSIMMSLYCKRMPHTRGSVLLPAGSSTASARARCADAA